MEGSFLLHILVFHAYIFDTVIRKLYECMLLRVLLQYDIANMPRDRKRAVFKVI